MSVLCGVSNKDNAGDKVSVNYDLRAGGIGSSQLIIYAKCAPVNSFGY